MTRIVSTAGIGLMVSLGAAPVAAQSQVPSRAAVDQRYQIGLMESVLEQAVEHGATNTRNRIQAVLPPADMLLSANAHVRGFRLEGYGVFFDVDVPALDTSLPLSFRMLDQNGLGLESALREIRSLVEKSGDANVEQALKRLELQVAPGGTFAAASPPRETGGLSKAPTGARLVTGSAATVSDAAPAAPPDSILNDPEAAYRAEVREALIDAMLEHSRGLAVASGEWLHIAARRNDDRPRRIGTVDTDAATLHIRVRGADLTAFLAGQISREDAVARMELKMF